MLTADPTYVALTLASAHFDGLTANSLGRSVHEANRSCLRMPKSAVHASASQCSLPQHKRIPGLTLAVKITQ